MSKEFTTPSKRGIWIITNTTESDTSETMPLSTGGDPYRQIYRQPMKTSAVEAKSHINAETLQQNVAEFLAVVEAAFNQAEQFQVAPSLYLTQMKNAISDKKWIKSRQRMDQKQLGDRLIH